MPLRFEIFTVLYKFVNSADNFIVIGSDVALRKLELSHLIALIHSFFNPLVPTEVSGGLELRTVLGDRI